MKWFVLCAALFAGPAFADIAPPPPTPPTEQPAPTPTPAPAPTPTPPTGRIQGGWGYVYACYALAVGGSLLYALSLYLRRPGAKPT